MEVLVIDGAAVSDVVGNSSSEPVGDKDVETSPKKTTT